MHGRGRMHGTKCVHAYRFIQPHYIFFSHLLHACTQGFEALPLPIYLPYSSNSSNSSYTANVTVIPISIAYSAQGSIAMSTVSGYWSEDIAQPLIMAEMPASLDLRADFYLSGVEHFTSEIMLSSVAHGPCMHTQTICLACLHAFMVRPKLCMEVPLPAKLAFAQLYAV